MANPRRLSLITQNLRRGDDEDAELLARLGRSDLRLIQPVEVRTVEAQEGLAWVRSHRTLVEARTKLINSCRGLAKSHGTRLPTCDARSFAGKVMGQLPEELSEALGPLVETIGELTQKIRRMDRAIEKLAKERFPATERLLQVRGVGALTALAYVAVRTASCAASDSA